MKTQVKLILILCLSLFALQKGHSINQKTIVSQEKSTIELLKTQFSIDDFLKKDRRQIEEQIGQKLTFKERLKLNFIQRSIRKAARKGEHKKTIKQRLESDEFDINPGALILGLLLGLIGVVVVFISFKNDPDRARKSAWIGFGIRFVIILIFISIILRTLAF